MKPSTLLKKAHKLGKKQMYGAYRNLFNDEYCAVGVMGCLMNKLDPDVSFSGANLIEDLSGRSMADVDFKEEFGLPFSVNLFRTIVVLNDNLRLTFKEISDFLRISCGL